MIKFKLLQVTIKILYNLAMTHVSSYRLQWFESFLLLMFLSSLFPEQVKVFTWCHPPFPLPLKIDLPWLNRSPISFMRAQWLFETTPGYPFTEFFLVSVSVLRIYKSKEQLRIYLAISHSQSSFPWVLVVSIGMCQVWAAHLILKSLPPMLPATAMLETKTQTNRR